MAWVAALAGVLVIVGLGATSWSYSQIWSHPEPLWRWAIEVDPDCARCHSNLAEVLLESPRRESRAAEAATLLRRAIALQPDLREANFNLGAALMMQGRYAEAEAPLHRSLEPAPAPIIVYERLGRLYLLERRYEEAIPMLRNVVRSAPHVVHVRAHLVEALRGRARELQAKERGAEAEPFLSESRALERDIVGRP
jgi:tetratricopeptide (TPR) repeat protein